MIERDSEDAVNTGDRLAGRIFKEYTSPEAISKYTGATAGYGISYLA